MFGVKDPIFVVDDGHWPKDKCAQVLRTIDATGKVGRSQLDHMFTESRGFGLAFTKHHVDEVRIAHPFLQAFVDEVCAPDALATTLTTFERLRRDSAPAPNAFYVNVLVVEEGAHVGAHIDGTLGPMFGVDRLTPEAVSVQYLHVDDDEEGGQLLLFAGSQVLAELEPSTGMFVQFNGKARHGVRASDRRRVSLVCEQYVVDDELLACLPEPLLQSRAMDPAFAKPTTVDTNENDAADFKSLLRRRRQK